jgi:hypothetical protein
MTRGQKLGGIAVFAFAGCGVLLSVRAARPPVPLASANLADASTHTCIDMNGKVFEWGFSNVPFAAICDAKPDAAK